MSDVVIFIPGIMGSVLSHNDEIIWPPPLRELIFSCDLDKILKDNVVAKDILRTFSSVQFYSKIINNLEQWGFSEHTKPKTLYVFPYDWRKDNRDSAQQLAILIGAIWIEHGSGCDVTIISHSMGGLIARYFLESGFFLKKNGFNAIKRLITIGIPHMGAPVALCAALGFEPCRFLNGKQVRILSNDSRYPSLFQLLPPSETLFAAEYGKECRLEPLNPYDKPLKYAGDRIDADEVLTKKNLEASQNFWLGLNTSKKPSHVRYVFFYGVGKSTAVATYLEKASAPNGLYYEIENVFSNAGDGVVPVWSSSLGGIQNIAIEGSHDKIYESKKFTQYLGIILGKPALRADSQNEVDIIINEIVYTHNYQFGITILNDDALDITNYKLVLLRLSDSQGNMATAPSVEKEITIHPTSSSRIYEKITTPIVPGLFRVILEDNYNAEIASQEFFIQKIR